MNYQDILTPEFIDEIVRKEMEMTIDLQRKLPRESDSENIARSAATIWNYYGGVQATTQESLEGEDGE